MKNFSFHIPKNNCRFEPHNAWEKSYLNFLNQDKAQAPGESPATIRFSDVLCNDLSLNFKLKKMHNTKSPSTKKAPILQIRTEVLGPNSYHIHFRINNFYRVIPCDSLAQVRSFIKNAEEAKRHEIKIVLKEKEGGTES